MTVCITLLSNDRAHAFPIDIGKTIKLIPISDRVTEVDVASILTIVFIASKIVVRVLYLFNFFFDI